MTQFQDSPTADYYLSAGCPVSCLAFIQNDKDYLLVGLTTGELRIYDCSTWKQLEIIDVFLKGFLWLEALDESTLVCQGRFESLKIISLTSSTDSLKQDTQSAASTTSLNGDQVELDTNKLTNLATETLKVLNISEETNCVINNDDTKDNVNCNRSSLLVEKASFMVSHEGFCKGFVLPGKDIVVAPSSACSLMVVKSVGQFIRPIASLNPEKTFSDVKFGTLMCCTNATTGKVLAGYENSDVILWDWTNSTAVFRMSLTQCGTLMSMASSLDNRQFVVAGAEDKVVILNVNEDFTLEILKERELTNPGVSVVKIRPDQRIMLTGGWDSRIRIFSWKRPEKCKPLAVLQFHCMAVECLAFTTGPLRAGRIRKSLFAAGSKDGKISLWTIYN